jgi:lysozyme family protein
MPAPLLTDLAPEYQALFDSCKASNPMSVWAVINRIRSGQARYEAIAAKAKVPWFVIALIHNTECSLDFKKHLHNGDPLTSRTVLVPAGRPRTGTPPFTFEESAIDALEYDGLIGWKDWSIPGILFKLEGFNGWGYRPRKIHSPYLWAGCQHYKAGKFIRDRVWSPTAVSKQIGTAVILKVMHQAGLLTTLATPSLFHKSPTLSQKSPSLFQKVGNWIKDHLTRN